MSKKFFNTMMQGMEEARAYMEGARDGYRVTKVAVHNCEKLGKDQRTMPPESQVRMDDRLKEALGNVPRDKHA